MTQCSDSENNHHNIIVEGRRDSLIRTCPTCGHHIKCQEQVLLLLINLFVNKHVIDIINLLINYFFSFEGDVPLCNCLVNLIQLDSFSIIFWVFFMQEIYFIVVLINYQGGGIHDLPGLPAGVKFDPTDQEILEHLEAKVRSDIHKLHPLIDEFIPTLEGENGICYTHPEKLPGQIQYVQSLNSQILYVRSVQIYSFKHFFTIIG